MSKLSVDYKYLDKTLNPDANRIPLKGNEHKIVRVAFDLFKFKDEGSEDLWQVQADDDGNEFLVRTYDLPNEDKEITSSDWNVSLDKKNANLTVSYHGIPIQRLAALDYGAKTAEDARMLSEVVIKKLSTDKDFVVNFVNTLTPEKRATLNEIFAAIPIDPATKARPVPGAPPFIPPKEEELPIETTKEPTEEPQPKEVELGNKVEVLNRDDADNMYELAKLSYSSPVQWIQSEINITNQNAQEMIEEALSSGQKVIKVVESGDETKPGQLWFFKSNL